MTIMKTINVTLRLMCIFALASIMSGCLKEDMSKCLDPEFETVTINLTVRAFCTTGIEFTEAEVPHVTLYVFDDGLHFVKVVDAIVCQPMSIEVPADRDVHFVAWGNMGEQMQICTESVIGKRGCARNNVFGEYPLYGLSPHAF